MRACLCLVLAIAAGPLVGQEPVPITHEVFTLPNGLSVILAPDRNAQVVAISVWYGVGSRDEVPGRTGFAHLFEHMMFEGSANLAPGDHGKLVTRAGGMLNAQTTEDRTTYWEILPSNQFELGLWLEAERMRSLVVTDENFENQRAAVQEEVRLKVENPPYVQAFTNAMSALADPENCFGYSHSAFGSMEDLRAATAEEARTFFRRYYVPSNATLAVAGDFDAEAAKRLIHRFFVGITAGEAPDPPACERALSPGEVRLRAHDPKAALPAVARYYRIPGVAHADYPALELLGHILGQGESSRLNRSLVRERKVAAAAFGLVNPPWPREGITSLFVAAFPAPGVPIDTVAVALTAEVDRLVREGPTEEELRKARNTIRAQRIMERQTAQGRVEALQAAAFFFGDPGAVESNLTRYETVTRADMRDVAARYLVVENSVFTIVSPEAP